MLVTQTNESVRSIIDGGGKSVKLSIESDPDCFDCRRDDLLADRQGADG